jgi:hypothetical protein
LYRDEGKISAGSREHIESVHPHQSLLVAVIEVIIEAVIEAVMYQS